MCDRAAGEPQYHRRRVEGHCGQGVGTALMTAMTDLADNWLGLRRIELHVYTNNEPAVHLYDKFGFVIEGTARQFALRGGAYVDAYAMARPHP